MAQVKNGRSEWGWALAAGLLLRLLFVAKHPRFVGDTLVYGDLAQNMLRHHVYGLSEDGAVRSTLIRLPGYPLFLAGCFAVFGIAHYLPVLGIQVAVDLLGCLLLAWTAETLWTAREGRLCLWLACLCPFTANYTAAALTETLSIFAVTLGFFAFVRWLGATGVNRRAGGWAALVGISMAAAVLLRPDGILLSAALLPGMLWVALTHRTGTRRGERTSRLKALSEPAVAAGVVVLCLALWSVRNFRVFHVVQPLAPKYANDPGEPAPLGFARWYRTWGTGLGDTTRVYWQYDGSLLAVADLPAWAFDSAAERRQTAALYRRYNAESASTPEIEAAFAELATQRVRAHPVRFYLLFPLARLADMWLRPRTELIQRMPLDWWKLQERPRASAFSYAYGLLNLLLLTLAARGASQWGRAQWGKKGVVAAAMIAYVLLRSALLMTIDNSEPRYVLECYPLLLLMASVALAHPARHQQAQLRSASGSRG